MTPINPELYRDAKKFLSDLAASTDKTGSAIQQDVTEIIDKVKKRGDAAVREYTERFDNIQRETARLSAEEIAGSKPVDAELMQDLSAAADNIRAFHKMELSQIKNWTMPCDTGTVGQRWSPLRRAGVYIPGGTAAYPSSVLMNVIPAQVSGVREIALASPPCRETGTVHPLVLAAARLLGITEIYAVGGAQAVAALAWGTETIKPVDTITGPGNAWVAEAKKQVFGRVGIDSIAGPSEIAVIADSTADPRLIAADLLSQAEHDTDARVFLLSPDMNTITRSVEELNRQIETLPRRDIAGRSVKANGYFMCTGSITEAAELVNTIAPEHVEVLTADPLDTARLVKNAGALFLGSYSCESIGDYWAGPNHTLPTNRTARFSSALSVRDFIRWTSVIQSQRSSLEKVYPCIARLARAEGLEAHARAVEQRFSDKENYNG